VNPEPLDYAGPGSTEDRPRHPPAVTWLMTLSVIAFFAVGVLGLLYIDVLGAAAGGMMIAAAVFLLIAVFGFLSRPRPAFLAGAIMTLGAFLAAALAAGLSHLLEQQLEQRILATRPMNLSGVIVVSAQSDVGKDLAAMQAARSLNAVSAFLAFCLLVYLIVQSFGRRPD